MKTSVKIMLIASSMVLVSACNSNIRHAIGIKKQAPDAFRVVSNPPLSVPPDFSLLPPTPGAKNPNQPDMAELAKEELFKQGAKSTKQDTTAQGTSAAERSLLEAAKVEEADPEIRSVLLRDDQLIAREEKASFIGKWIGTEEKQDPIVNALQEKDRIAQNQEAGKSVNEGNVPTLTKDPADKGFFNRILGL